MKVLADANVIVSAIYFRGRCEEAMLSISRDHHLVHSEKLQSEVAEVLGRAKFRRHPRFDRRADFLTDVFGMSRPTVVVTSLRECRDPNDDHVLALALAVTATGKAPDSRTKRAAHRVMRSPPRRRVIDASG